MEVILMNVNEFLSAMEYTNIRMSERHTVIKLGKKFTPIYIVLYKNKSLLGDTIRNVTKEPFSHVAISFDTSMHNMFAFGIAPVKNGKKVEFINGALRESLGERNNRYSYDKTTKYGIYTMFVEDCILTKLKNRVRKIYNNRKKYKFNIPGLVKYAFGQESKSETMMFCSQFVSKILEESGAAKLERDSSLYSPWQITSLKNIIHVEDDIISNFDKNRVDQIMDKISNDFRTS